MKTHKDLLVWQKSIALVTEIYKLTNEFPNHEMYGLVSQLRRAAISIPSNIAEGAGRKSDKDFVRFLYIARASAAEVETQLIISENLGYLQSNKNNLKEELIGISKMLTALINKINKRIKE
ncbi:four helix bundle protein [Polaribacter sp. MSW13]|uniref:Four helix bundle protein n=1 Tax=Polaribacter marinus TaxID=2916838 RepID=A0A9X2AKY0_9FLAO|nr:four helix bundle protein [Polaribacter marinus]MCI2227534.1 four helix bundle protein [Polaribacter marinus]